MNRCPVCADSSCRNRTEPDGTVLFDCPRCGAFTLTAALLGTLPRLVDGGLIDRSALSHHIRLRQPNDGGALALRDGDVETFRRHLRRLTPREQQEQLILWIGDNQATPGQFVQSRKKPLSSVVGCHVTALGAAEPELDWLVDQMRPLGVFESHFGIQPSVVSLRLTLDGWERHAALSRRRAGGRRALLAVASGNPELDRVATECFAPAAARAGFELTRHPGAPGAGQGNALSRDAVRAAAFVIVDLTHDDAAVVFAAGFAEGAGVPVFYTCKEGGRSPAEVATIVWRGDDLAAATDRLAAAIAAGATRRD